MSRFNEVTYHKNNQTADVGAGNLWDNVYTTLEPYGVNVIGGRIESRSFHSLNDGIALFSQRTVL